MPAAPSANTLAPGKRMTVSQSFAAIRERHGIAMVAFIPAAYPNLETTAALLPELEKSGATLIEIGFPFSDPVADGPIIQEAFTYALANKVKVAQVFETVRAARPHVSIPIFGMLSFSIVFRYGVDAFVAAAKSAGFDGLIIPDLPPPEAQRVCRQIAAGGLMTSLLVAPTTAPERRQEIAELSTGFVYYLSVSGITGERDRLPENLQDNVRAIKAVTDHPVCVGFGISKPEHVRSLQGVADGAIVGSAIVRRMKEQMHGDPTVITRVVCDYLRDLMRAV